MRKFSSTFNSYESLSLKSASVKQCLQISRALVMSSGVNILCVFGFVLCIADDMIKPDLKLLEIPYSALDPFIGLFGGDAQIAFSVS